MAEVITAEAGQTRSADPRRLSPGLAFLGGLIGVGYLYVGRIGYAIAFAVAPYVFLFASGRTRLIVDPIGWYASFAVLALLWLVQLVHPVVLAWSRPLGPAKPYNRWWWYVAWIAGVTTASMLLVPEPATAFGYQNYYVPAGSMSPTVQPGDRVVVDTWRYRDASPAFGDIVVCDLGDGTLVVKRVVGVPGDTIEIRGPLLIRNGNPVDEPYLSSEPGMTLPDSPPLALGTDEFFVLGDHRRNSRDSRQEGPVSRDEIPGRVEFIYFARDWGRFPALLAAD
ncbi:MAG: signal peptidase I [Lysobacterales bacterium]|nr:MAG: signal peptidase I [Xanthomonadales bacterium]